MTELTDLLAGADSVELKLTVPEAQQRPVVRALGLDPLDAQVRQVYFFDTPDLRLDKAGVVARARRIQGREHDSVVKLRPAIPSELPRKLRKLPEFVVEVDTMPGGQHVCSAALKNMLGPQDVHRATGGELTLRKLFSKDQRAFFETHAPEDVGFGDLAVLGPIFVLKMKFRPDGFDRKMAAEIWLYPDDQRILELSTRCLPDEASDVAEQGRRYLKSKGIEIDGEQQTKTRTALEFFSAKLSPTPRRSVAPRRPARSTAGSRSRQPRSPRATGSVATGS
jgi:hypothetical protein